MTSAERAQTIAVAQVVDLMRRCHLTPADLTEYGGEDIPNPKLPEKICNPARIKKARAVERCWELIARLGLTFTAFESGSHAISATATARLSGPKATWRGGYQKIINVFNDLPK